MIEKMTIWKASSLLLLAFSVFMESTAQNLRPLTNINSPYNESHAVLSPFGPLFFSVGYHPENTGGQTDSGDIWMSEMTGNGDWTKPQRVKSLSTTGNDVVIGFPDPITVMVYHDGQQKSQGIHIYNRFGNSWNYLRPLQMGNFKNEGGHFSGRLSENGEVIIMSMKSFGSYGNEDIYVSFKENENFWSSPVNLGSNINSYAQEQTPFLTGDMRTLYFSTNASADGRGKNIFYSQRLDDSWQNWTKPVEISSANSIGSESGYAKIFPQENMAIFTTTANSEGLGDFVLIDFENIPLVELEAKLDDLDSIESAIAPEQQNSSNITLNETGNRNEPENLVSMQPKLGQTKLPEEKTDPSKADIIPLTEETVKNPSLSDNSESPELNTIEKADFQKLDLHEVKVLDRQTGEAISYKLTVSDNNSFIKELKTQEEMRVAFETWDWKHIMVLAKGYLPVGLSLGEWQELENDILYLDPADSGASLVLRNIQFTRGTSEFADNRTLLELDRLVLFMKENEDITIRLEGHTDNLGDPGLNKELSIKRASKIRTYLAMKGIDFERIRTSGWGGTKPLANNNTQEGREINRRVELYIER